MKLRQRQYIRIILINLNQLVYQLISSNYPRYIEKLDENLERQLLLKAKNFITFSLALDESTNVDRTISTVSKNRL